VTSRSPALFLVFVAAFGFVSTPRAAPQTFNTALPVAESEFVFRGQFVYRKATGDPGSADRRLRVLGGVSVLGYGVTGDLAVFGVLPYLDKRMDLTMPDGQRLTRNTFGIADARLFGRYTVFKVNTPGRTFRLAPFFGLEFPTGDDNHEDSLGRLPAPLQLGSGSWDPFGGIIVTYQTLDFQFDGQASYKLNTKANDFEFGDEARLDISLQYRVWPRELGQGIPGFLYVILEGNLTYRDKNEIGGVKDPNSGGMTFFLSPGIQYVTKRWIIEGIVQLPVSQNLNGTALKDDYAFRAGFRINF